MESTHQCGIFYYYYYHYYYCYYYYYHYFNDHLPWSNPVKVRIRVDTTWGLVE